MDTVKKAISFSMFRTFFVFPTPVFVCDFGLKTHIGYIGAKLCYKNTSKYACVNIVEVCKIYILPVPHC